MELKTCPFCGEPAKLMPVGTMFSAGCVNGDCESMPSVEYRTETAAAFGWNTRVRDSAVAALVKAATVLTDLAFKSFPMPPDEMKTKLTKAMDELRAALAALESKGQP